MTSAAALQFLPAADDLKQSCCLIFVFSSGILRVDGCCCEKDCIFWF